MQILYSGPAWLSYEIDYVSSHIAVREVSTSFALASELSRNGEKRNHSSAHDLR